MYLLNYRNKFRELLFAIIPSIRIYDTFNPNVIIKANFMTRLYGIALFFNSSSRMARKVLNYII